MEEALDHDLGVRRDRQAGDRRLDDLVRLAADRASEVVLRHAVGDLEARRDEEERLAPDDERDRARLLALEVLVAELAPVLPWRDVDRHVTSVLHLDAIGPDVDPVAVRILEDVADAGAEVPAAVERMPLRGGEFEHVDVLAAQHVLEDGAVLHEPRGHAPVRLGETEELVHERPPLDVDGKPERERQASARRVRVHEDAVAGGIARDVVEEDRGRVVGVVEHLRDAADVLLPGRAPDVAHLSERPRLRDPVAEVLVPHHGLPRMVLPFWHSDSVGRSPRCVAGFRSPSPSRSSPVPAAAPAPRPDRRAPVALPRRRPRHRHPLRSTFRSRTATSSATSCRSGRRRRAASSSSRS